MRLALFNEYLSQPLLDALQSLAIVSDVDLLFSSGSPLDIWRRLPPGLISLQDFNHRFQTVLAKSSSQPSVGDPLHDDNDDEKERLHIPEVPELDQLLNGFRCPSIIEMSGPSGSGKSALALQIVCGHLSSSSTASAIWLDTTGDFSPLRAIDVLRSYTGQASATVLERIQVALAFNIESVYDIFDSIGHNPQPSIKFIVIDAITPLLGPNLSAVSSEGHAVMATFVRQLRAIAQANNMFVLVINTTTSTPYGVSNPLSSFISTTRKPSLGSTFTFLVDATIWLAKMDRSGQNEGETVHAAEVFKSRTSGTKRWCLFGIHDGILIPTSGRSSVVRTSGS